MDENLEWDDEDLEIVDLGKKSVNKNVSGKKITIYFMSTIGPGEKKEKLNVYSGYRIGDIKETVGNLFALKPEDFHLSSGGITLDEKKALFEYEISDGDDILLIPASVAGCK
ncbi:MAG: ubiquitin-like domain-containing protein [Promethearchaeota archaeon]